MKNKKTRFDYKRGLEWLQKWFVTIDQILHSKASYFFDWGNQNGKVRNRTIQRWTKVCVNLWHFLEKDTSIWFLRWLSQAAQNVLKEAWSVPKAIKLWRILLDISVKVASCKNMLFGFMHMLKPEKILFRNWSIILITRPFNFPKLSLNEKIVSFQLTLEYKNFIWVEIGSRSSASSISSQFENSKYSCGLFRNMDIANSDNTSVAVPRQHFYSA